MAKLRANGFGALLVADGVGVGKTIAASYAIYCESVVLREPSIILCPPTLVDKWRLELREKFGIAAIAVLSAESLATIHEESLALDSSRPANVYVLPYSVLIRAGKPEHLRVGLLVFDEIHAIRNPETKTYAAALDLSKTASNRLGLSATPIQNRLTDLSSELSILLPNFDLAILSPVITELWLTRRTSLLHPLTTRFTRENLRVHFTRREIQTRQIAYPSEYATAVERLLETDSPTTASRLEVVTRLRIAASSPSAFYKSLRMTPPASLHNTKLEALEVLLSSEPHQKWLVFCEFSLTAEEIIDRIAGRAAFLLTGKTPLDERTSILDNFKASESAVLVLTSVGSEGLDMQTCSRLVNYDLHWNPMVLEQRIGRIDRIGQDKGTVKVFNFVVRGSIDERVLRVLGKKLALVADTFAGTDRVLSSETLGPASGELNSLAALGIPHEVVEANEIEEAEHFLAGYEFAAQIPAEDYDFAKSIDSGHCKFSLWPKDTARWRTSVPWTNDSTQARRWFTAVRKQGQQLKAILDEYEHDA